jgi:predicted tellurium resistance membrane protein TerC
MVIAVILAMIVSDLRQFPATLSTSIHCARELLILIGVLLVAEGVGQHIPKGYVYFAMAFSVGVEMLNIRMRKASPDAGH